MTYPLPETWQCVACGHTESICPGKAFRRCSNCGEEYEIIAFSRRMPGFAFGADTIHAVTKGKTTGKVINNGGYKLIPIEDMMGIPYYRDLAENKFGWKLPEGSYIIGEGGSYKILADYQI